MVRMLSVRMSSSSVFSAPCSVCIYVGSWVASVMGKAPEATEKSGTSSSFKYPLHSDTHNHHSERLYSWLLNVHSKQPA